MTSFFPKRIFSPNWVTWATFPSGLLDRINIKILKQAPGINQKLKSLVLKTKKPQELTQQLKPELGTKSSCRGTELLTLSKPRMTSKLARDENCNESIRAGMVPSMF